jgi:chitin synthase
MLEFAGQDLTNYFPVPLTKGCPGLVNKDFAFTYANFTPTVAYAVHTSGSLQTENGTKLNDENWYYDRLQPFLDQRYKGQFVWSKNDIQAQADDSGK